MPTFDDPEELCAVRVFAALLRGGRR